MKYLLDSNIFIQAHRMHYPFDVVPGFWNKLVDLSNRGIIVSIDKVKKELCDISTPDTLSNWCMDDFNGDFFIDTSSCIDKYSEIALWVHSHPNYIQNAKDEFLITDLADPWLIAYAMKNNCTIVTHEISSNSIKRVKIPEPCNHFGVPYTTLIQMFRNLGESF
ncbi:DUF4411 family protein [Flavobacterium aestivum]|uniref:DUF4411 family protein n=1 Tax=Flavobacterium aestivum TaxID=3003257 RepID=UPI002285FD04|nr:DUF4411 family protein [Flavobacterium aestivum]